MIDPLILLCLLLLYHPCCSKRHSILLSQLFLLRIKANFALQIQFMNIGCHSVVLVDMELMMMGHKKNVLVKEGCRVEDGWIVQVAGWTGGWNRCLAGATKVNTG